MSAIVNSCLDKCEFICKVYEDIINEEYGLNCESNYNITICDVYQNFIPRSVYVYPTIETPTTSTTDNIIIITCNLVLSQINAVCNSLILTQL